MTKVLFTHSYFLRLDQKQWKKSEPYVPIGTLTAAAFIRREGYDVYFHDSMFSHSAEEIESVIRETRPSYLVIYDDGFNYLTKMCLTNMRYAAFKMAEIGKAYDCKVIISSSDSTDHFKEYLDHNTDFIIIGEGEETLLQLLNALESGNDVGLLAGIAYRDTKRHIECRNDKRPVIRDLDSLPHPAWDLVDITPYKKAWIGKKGYFSLNIATTRGCPFKCNWCAKPIYGNSYKSRSPEHVVIELLFLKRTFGFDHIWFCDDIFGLKPGWVNNFARLLIESGLSFKFKIQSRVDLLLKENAINELAAAGCDEVWVGAESGSQKILDAMDKGIRVEQIYEATLKLKAAGIRPAFFLQFGYPGENREDISATLKMLFSLMPGDMGISVSYPLPGTKFYDNVKNDLLEKANWTDSGDLDLMFQNTYSRKFYRALHRYIHKKFRKKEAVIAIKELIYNPFTANNNKLYKAASLCWYFFAERFTELQFLIISANE
jgi:radical SAM superfamily enzyme YgiQ (UPF0313 family)